MNKKTEQEWQAGLSPEQFRVCRQSATESAFSGTLLHEKRTGNYLCACCKQVLFNSDTKCDSGSGWPSFYNKNFHKDINSISGITGSSRSRGTFAIISCALALGNFCLASCNAKISLPIIAG
jgi:peptide methionine sulfoxide reductase MsrB